MKHVITKLLEQGYTAMIMGSPFLKVAEKKGKKIQIQTCEKGLAHSDIHHWAKISENLMDFTDVWHLFIQKPRG